MEFQCGNDPYTLLGDKIVEEHIHNIVKCITEHLAEEIKPEAIVLSGSLGRGEATAYQKNGQVNLISDLEIGCIDKNWLKKRHFRKLELFLVKKYDIDLTLNFFLPRRFTKCVPVNWAPVGSPLSIDQYELMKAARFIYGPDPRRHGPEVNSDDIPTWEGIRLLFNRMAEVMDAVSLGMPSGEKKLKKACNKLLIASGDVILLCARQYHHLYRERMKILKKMLEVRKTICNDLSVDEYESIIRAYASKLYSLANKSLDIEKLITESLSISEKVFKYVIYIDLGFKYSSYQEFCDEYLVHPKIKEYCRTMPVLQNAVSLIKGRWGNISLPSKDYFSSISVLNKVYVELPIWLYGYFKPQWDENKGQYLLQGKADLYGKGIFDRWKILCE